MTTDEKIMKVWRARRNEAHPALLAQILGELARGYTPDGGHRVLAVGPANAAVDRACGTPTEV